MIASQLVEHLTGAVDLDQVPSASPNTCGWRRTSLSWIALRDVGDREPTLLLGDRGVELDLVEQVAELLDQRLVGGRVVGVELLDRVDDLVGLLDEVGDQRRVGLLDVPRALLAERAGELVEAHVAVADRQRRAPGCTAHVRWSASTVRSISAQVVCDDPLVRACRAPCSSTTGVASRSPVGSSMLSLMSDSTQLAWVWATSSAPVTSGRGGGELVAVDQPDAGLDRIDAEPRPHDVEERHRRQHDALDAGVGAQRAHRSLEHERRAGHGVQHLAVLGRGGDEALGDLGVHVLEAVGRLVHVVERDGVGHEVRRSGGGRCAGSGARSGRSSPASRR